MCEFDPRNDSRYLDPCMKCIIIALQELGVETVACCCGHDIYPMTIVIRVDEVTTKEMLSGVVFKNRKKKYYRHDENGVYYIPEIVS